MVVDAGSGPVGVLDQIMYDEAYTKALSDGIDLLGYGSRDNLAALEMAPIDGPSTAGDDSRVRPAHPPITSIMTSLVDMDDFGGGDGVAVQDLNGLDPGGIEAVKTPPNGSGVVSDVSPVPTNANGTVDPSAVDFGRVNDSNNLSAQPAIGVPTLGGHASAPQASSVRVTTPTTRVLGAYDRAMLLSMQARELRQRFCDVFDAPPPLKRRDDTSWLRNALAPHAVDAREGSPTVVPSVRPTVNSLGGPTGFQSRPTIAGFQTDAVRFEGQIDRNATDDDSDEEMDEKGTEEDTLDAFEFEVTMTPSPVDRHGEEHSDLDFDSFGVVDGTTTVRPHPLEWTTHSGHSPNAADVLARVAQRTPVSTSGWAMAAAAAAKAFMQASDKTQRAAAARNECQRLANEAGKAVRRARKAAANAARVRNGTEQPVLFKSIPPKIARRLKETGVCAKEGKPLGRPSKKQKRANDFAARDFSRSETPESNSDFVSDGVGTEEAVPTGPPPRPKIINLTKGDENEAARVVRIWQAAVNADVCHVCGEGDSDRWGSSDEIVFCDGCDVQVHLSCYGLKQVPKGKWHCQGCMDGVDPGDATNGEVGTCALCPQPGGALATLDPPSHWDVAWETPGTHAHVSCASCLPEVFVWKDVAGRETTGAVIDMSFVKAQRINLRCGLCRQEGACTQCAMKKCFASFHPLCARGAGFKTERHVSQDGRHLWFCKTHSGERWEGSRLDAAGKGNGLGDASGKKAKGGKSLRKAKASRKGKNVEVIVAPNVVVGATETPKATETPVVVADETAVMAKPEEKLVANGEAEKVGE